MRQGSHQIRRGVFASQAPTPSRVDFFIIAMSVTASMTVPMMTTTIPIQEPPQSQRLLLRAFIAASLRLFQANYVYLPRSLHYNSFNAEKVPHDARYLTGGDSAG